MIRFLCPGCPVAFSVDEAKAGKPGTCPKCSVRFIVPHPVGVVPPPTPPPPIAPAYNPIAPVAIDPCPRCQMKSAVLTSDLGINVECPKCKTVFPATRLGTRTVDPVLKTIVRSAEDDAEDDRPYRTRDERPTRPRKPQSRRRYQDDDHEDDRPRRKRKKTRAQDTREMLRMCISIVGVITIVLGVMTLLGALFIFLLGGGLFSLTEAARADAPPMMQNNPAFRAARGISAGLILCCALPLLLFGGLQIFAGIRTLHRDSIGRILVIIFAALGICGALMAFGSTYTVPAPDDPFGRTRTQTNFFVPLLQLAYGVFSLCVMLWPGSNDEFR